MTCWLAASPRFSWGGCCFLRCLLASKYLGPLPPTKQKWKEVGRSAAKEIWKRTAHCKCGLSSAKKCFWSLKSFFFLFFSFYWEWNKNRPTKKDSRELVRPRDWTCVSCVSCIGRLFPGRLWPAGKNCLPLLLFRNHLWLRVNFLYLYLYASRALRKQFVVITFLWFFVHRILKGGILLVSPPLNMVPWTWCLLNKYLLEKNALI